jgi:1-acyl-sn-glycerol-3-phosphate acyltransferase
MSADDERDRLTVLIAVVLGTLAVVVALLSLTPDPEKVRGFGIALVAGGLIPLVYWSPYRVQGFVPWASTAFLGVAVYGLATGDWIGWLLGLPAGVMYLALFTGLAIRTRGGLLATFAAGLVGIGLVVVGWTPLGWLGWGLFGLTGSLALFAWVRLLRPAVELTAEPLLWLMYKVRSAGPGLAKVPACGPCLVIANHSCWPDPLFLAKVLPRPVTPMMTARFYDLPVMRWLMRHVFRVIRVPEKPLKQSAPEIDDAIAALDRGECVVIFPEGYLRRSDDRLLRRFGRGVWHILRSRPNTPVFPCWIEGGWGSYMSYANGPPTKNKRPDVRRPIGVGVSGPVTVDPATLEDHLRTRVFLMNQVIDARKHLGLPDLPRVELPERDEEKDEEGG